MIGREAYHNPYALAEVDSLFYGKSEPILSRYEILEAYSLYSEQQATLGIPINHMTRHILGLFQGVPGARAWRRHISENVASEMCLKSLLLAKAPVIS